MTGPIPAHRLGSPYTKSTGPCDAARARPGIFETAGGEQAFLALAQAHHARCVAAADDAGLPAKPELREALRAYME
jgi:hypothetical protein